ncbi:MAG: hypothetical protein VKN72_00510 [Nostocales cyanobacterium 94392]|nr:hypothetical protein [Nostocales cyanobacterium 94392]
MSQSSYFNNSSCFNRASKIWSFDFLLCIFLLISAPYQIFDTAVAATFGVAQLQFEWLLIIPCILRLVYIILFPSSRIRIQRIRVIFYLLSPIILIIAYTLLVTTIQPSFLISNSVIQDNSTIYSFILKRGSKYLVYMAVSIYISLILKSWERIDIAIRFFVLGLCIAELLGLTQEIIYLIFKINIIPIVRTTRNFLEVSPTVNFLGLNFLRINSIASEPKVLSVLVVFLILFKFFWSSYIVQFPSQKIWFSKMDYYMKTSFPISVLTIILTFSGSGQFALLSAFVLILIFYKHIPTHSRLNQLYIYLICVICLALILLLPSIYSAIQSFLDVSILRRAGKLFDKLTLDSLLYTTSTDAEDGAFIYSFLSHPLAFSHGLGFGAYSNLAYEFVKTKYDATIASPFSRNIFIELVSSTGLVGLFLGFIFFKRNALNFFYIKSSIHIIIGFLILLNFFVRANVIVFFIIIGILLSINSIILLQSKVTNIYINKSLNLY